MNRKKILLMAMVTLLGTAGLTQGKDKKLGVTFDLTYVSKWLSKGSEVYGQQGALFETIDLDLWGTGFGAAVTHRSATASGYVDKERFDYKVYYGNSLFDGESYLTKYKFFWGFETYPDRPKKIGNVQAWKFAFSWPKLLPAGLIAKYIAHYEYPAGSGYNNSEYTGWLHRFGLGYDWNVPELPNPLHLSAEAAYRDGLGGGTKDHDWSHATLGISTKFKITDNLSFVPGLYHQISMDDSVCERDVTYCKLGLKYKF